MKHILFIGTKNHSRSRFAEILFNNLASKFLLDWKAFSRGIEVSGINEGPISTFALLACRNAYCELPKPIHYPMQLFPSDLLHADLIFSINEDEHRVYLESTYPRFSHKIQYLSIASQIKPKEGLKMLQSEMYRIIENLDRVPVATKLDTLFS
ncbi:MAG: hypothetical protein ACFCUU_19530 [Cyclobacteriaceae bacterium]